jgi:hypothetical protein
MYFRHPGVHAVVVFVLAVVLTQYFDYRDRVSELNRKTLEAKTVIKTASESKILSKENSVLSQGYKVVVKMPNRPAESIFVTVDDYARLKPSDTVCIQYSQLDGKNKDFQLCPKK